MQEFSNYNKKTEVFFKELFHSLKVRINTYKKNKYVSLILVKYNILNTIY